MGPQGPSSGWVGLSCFPFSWVKNIQIKNIKIEALLTFFNLFPLPGGVKVIIENSRGEMSLMGQDTIENVS